MHLAEMQFYQRMRVVHHAAAPRDGAIDQQADFFVQFAPERSFHAFPRFHLATRKFPVARIRFACRTAGEQKAAVGTLQNAYRYVH